MSVSAQGIPERQGHPGGGVVHGIKTNTLYDVFTIPSLGYERSIGDSFSAGINLHYAWWKSLPRKWYNQTYGGEIYGRWWFGETASGQKLSGHHLGAYVQAITYDIEYGGRGQQARRPNWAIGVEYGHSFPIAPHLNLDLALGVGYLFGKYEEYTPQHTHFVWEATYMRSWFGPTRAEISLVWLIGNDPLFWDSHRKKKK